MITCDDCNGNRFKMFLGVESPCNTCRGVGELMICDSFAFVPGAVMAFRNQRCHNCGVRERQHNIAEVHV